MRAGKLRHRVTIQQLALTRDAFGDAVEGWATVATVPAEVRMPSGAERFVGQADQERATVTHRIRMRYRGDLRPGSHRLIYDRRILDLEMAEDPDGRGRELVAICRELVGEQLAINGLDFSKAANSQYLPLLEAFA